MDTQIDFTCMGLDKECSDYLNWCIQHRDNLELLKQKEVFEIWEQKGEEGNAVLNFNRNGVLLRVNKNLFS